MPQITQDTTWSSGQVIDLTDSIEIASGVTLTIEDGVIVNGGFGQLLVNGSLIVEDNLDDDVIFRDVRIVAYIGADQISLLDVQYVNGDLDLRNLSKLSVRDSVFSNQGYGGRTEINLVGPQASEISGNIFEGWEPFAINIDDQHSLAISNNSFLSENSNNQGDSSIYLSGPVGANSSISIIDNNFMDGRFTYISVFGDAGELQVSGNFFEGISAGEEEEAVFDVEDEAGRLTDIEILNARSEPNPDAPIDIPNRDPYFQLYNEDSPGGVPVVGAVIFAPYPFDPDGIPQSVNYQWFKNGEPIADAIEQSYTLLPTDEGAELNVEISYQDLGGTDETIVSESTVPILSLADVPVGSFIIENTSRLDGAFFQENNVEPDRLPVTYPEVSLWFDSLGNRIISDFGRYQQPNINLGQETVGKQLILVILYRDRDGNLILEKSAPTPEVININDEAGLGIGAKDSHILGAPVEGSTLEPITNAIFDRDGFDPSAISYQWTRGGVDIPGATSKSYTLIQDDVGAIIDVIFSFTDNFGTLETLSSADINSNLFRGVIGPVSNVNDLPVGSVFLTGNAVVGQTVTADTSNLSDEDGLGAFSYQWVRDASAISGANDSTYEVTSADTGSRISVVVSYTDGFGANEQVVSFSTAEVGGTGGSDGGTSSNPSPILSGPVQSGIAGSDTFDVDPSGGAVRIQNFELGVDTLDLRGFDRADALNAFFNATAGSAVLRFNDGTVLTVEGEGVSPSTLGLDDLMLASGNLPPVGVVVISGDAVLGRTLTANVSGVTDPEGIAANTTSITWQRNGNDILGASGSNYTITQDDVGAVLNAKFSFTDQLGSDESVLSFPTAPVLPLGQSMNGTPEPDFIVGTDGTDLMKGFASDDVLFGQGGDDLIDGGSGNDIALYSGSQATYTLTVGPSSVLLLDRSIAGSGEDRLIDVEALSFGSGPMSADVDLVSVTGSSRLSSAEFEDVIELYIAYFNRAPDAVGLNFWGTAFANGVTLEQMATLFVDQDETRATYPDGTSNTDFVTAVYDNVLGRIPDLDGFNFWVDMLNRSDVTGVTRDQFILEVLRGVQDGSSDRAYLDTKVDIGAYFAVHRGMSDTDNASAAIMLFDGSQGSVNDAVAAIDGYYQDALDPIEGEFLMQVVGVLDNPFA